MRLTCPNCGAQYEVPDEVIPEAGRDVQCSNCGDTWFQHHPDNQPEDADEAAPHPGWDSPPDEPEDEPESVEDSEAEPETEPEPEEEPEPEAEVEPDDEADTEAPHEVPPRRELDPAITDLLREEATREEEARAAESSGGLEIQHDLGLDGQDKENDQRSQQVKSRMARLRGLPEDPEEEPLPEPDPGSRRNLLPDIDEINSSLSSESVRAEMSQSGEGDMADGEVLPRKPGGFRRGFMAIVLIVLLLVLLYLLAPTLAENIPALRGVLSSYVELVNGGRIALNDWLASMSAPPPE